MSPLNLTEEVSRTGAVGYIEPVLKCVLHVLIRKRPVLWIEEDTRPIAPEEEIAKLVAIIIFSFRRN